MMLSKPARSLGWNFPSEISCYRLLSIFLDCNFFKEKKDNLW